MSEPDNDPFHPGERQAQSLAKVVLHGAPIRDKMPDQHRAFFARLPMLLAAAADRAGWPTATALAGPPGFVSSPDPRILHVAVRPDLADPAASGLRAGAAIGLLGIDLGTRRRNRVNGNLLAVDTDGFSVEVRQSFGNCPQYIQAREVEAVERVHRGEIAEPLPGLDREARAFIQNADTFFVASGSGGLASKAAGLDISHRGGRPGFVRVDRNDVLTIPDFRGNRYFNTLGNLLVNPRAGLLFVNFTNGDLLQLQGQADISWDGADGFQGAERLWRVRITAGWRRRAVLPLRWAFRDYAPTTERTGAWDR